MKYLFAIFVIFSVILSSCTPVVYRNLAECNKNDVEIFKDITTILMQNNFVIKNANENIGYLNAEIDSPPLVAGTFGAKMIWDFNIRDGKITATYKSLMYETNRLGNVVSTTDPRYGSDEYNKGDKSYWNVRNSIEKVCNSRIVVVKEG
ncbi:MAG: hypothetical protein KGZ71_09835 [Desulfobulbaceae bacterium]|nr:hypothetical protein [Desulfobulbaceae bacterium]